MELVEIEQLQIMEKRQPVGRHCQRKGGDRFHCISKDMNLRKKVDNYYPQRRRWEEIPNIQSKVFKALVSLVKR